MQTGPNISRIAALIGDPARALMLQALMSGRALTASELAAHAGVGKATASSHLAQLVVGGLITARAEGRHKYHALASPAVAQTLESLIALAAGHGPAANPSKPLRTGPRDPALRHARLCYNHIAGTRGVQLYDSLTRRAAFIHGPDGMDLTPKGRQIFADLHLDLASLLVSQSTHTSPLCRECLDWSERRLHLAGRLGRALLAHVLACGWASTKSGDRILNFTPKGAAKFDLAFPLAP
jgi:DNA-binding transcriptional ArsR family regulator